MKRVILIAAAVVAGIFAATPAQAGNFPPQDVMWNGWCLGTPANPVSGDLVFVQPKCDQMWVFIDPNNAGQLQLSGTDLYLGFHGRHAVLTATSPTIVQYDPSTTQLTAGTGEHGVNYVVSSGRLVTISYDPAGDNWTFTP